MIYVTSPRSKVQSTHGYGYDRGWVLGPLFKISFILKICPFGGESALNRIEE